MTQLPRQANRELTLEEVQINHIIKILKLTDYNVRKTAKIVGITHNTVYNWMDRFNIKKPGK